jgi:hypothetical protein
MTGAMKKEMDADSSRNAGTFGATRS